MNKETTKTYLNSKQQPIDTDNFIVLEFLKLKQTLVKNVAVQGYLDNYF